MSGMMADIVISLILIAMVAGAVVYIYKEKKKGRRCIGCPSAGSCCRKKPAGESRSGGQTGD